MIDKKLGDIFVVIDKVGWSFVDFLYYAFRHKDNNGDDIHHKQAHANTIQKFLSGYTDRTPLIFGFTHQMAILMRIQSLCIW